MTKGTCTVDGCTKRIKARQICAMHYWRIMNKGTLDGVRPLYSTPEESFAARTRETDAGCIEWTGARQAQGYGVMRVGNKTVRAHRYAWERINGAIPAGLHIDHMCFNKACVNVDHLRAVAQAENNQNLPGVRRDNPSGFRGVGWHKAARKWSVTVKGKYYGLYSDREEAGRVASALRAELMPFSQN